MAIDFPNTPTTNQIYTVGSRSWKWDGTIWAIYSNNPVLYRQDSPPSSPQEGDQWFETDTGRMFVYYGTAWVELGNATDVAGALQPSQVTALSAVTTLTSDDVFPVVDGPSGAVASSKITYGDLVTNMSSSLAPGLVLITEVTASGTAGATNIQGCFSATYDNYRIEVTNLYSSSTANIGFQMLNGTTPLTTATYSHAFTGLSTLGASTNTFSNSFTRASVLDSYAAVTTGTCSFDIMRPFLSAQTNFIGGSSALNSGLNGYDIKTGIAIVETTTSYDGLRISAAAGNISFKARVYGYRQA